MRFIARDSPPHISTMTTVAAGDPASWSLRADNAPLFFWSSSAGEKPGLPVQPIPAARGLRLTTVGRRRLVKWSSLRLEICGGD
jgi:hypothetical protein